MDPFAPDDVTWHPVSDRLATGRRLVVGALCAVVAIAIAVVAVLAGQLWLLTLLVVPAAALAWAWWLIGRQVHAMGYAERADDLLVRHGVMFRSIVVVPYGRMQFVDVAAGPLARKLGYSSVQLHTASPGTDASIDGLVPDEAARLRDRLAQRGEARLAGL
ncbi:MAG TPA: PH domain-containing protein [Angustibacter sp.]|nr:PH domain-containing protein [Angustibacter sp.]